MTCVKHMVIGVNKTTYVISGIEDDDSALLGYAVDDVGQGMIAPSVGTSKAKAYHVSSIVERWI